MCGVTLYGLTHPEDITGTLDGVSWAHGLDFEHFVTEMMHRFGMSLEEVERAKHTPMPGDAWYIEKNTINPRNLSLIHLVQEVYKKQLLDPENLDRLSEMFSARMKETLQGPNLDFCTSDYNGCLYTVGAPGLRREIKLYPLVAVTMVDATVRSLFGPCMHRVEPDIVELLISFNTNAWVLFYGVPDFFGYSPLCGPRDRIKAALRAFISQPEEERSGQCLAIQRLLRWMEVMKIDLDSRVGLLFLFFFASIANEQNACYCFVAQLVCDRGMLDVVRQEIEPAWQSGELDVKYLMSSCPATNAIFDEVLRQRTNTFGWRFVREKIVIRGKELLPGTPVIIPIGALHSSAHIWGASVDDFDESRFYEKSAARMPHYRPFAGGSTHCPGRILARRETLAFLAILLRRFDITVLPTPGAPDGKLVFPEMENLRPPTGVKGPKQNMDLFVKLDERPVDQFAKRSSPQN
ncbi:hypothetical protein HIM_02297 [Hirsutella minnesotensis 3608]|nr:hypothetical protein HIM_02297 [Hirsutella minnesotensis 3608]